MNKKLFSIISIIALASFWSVSCKNDNTNPNNTSQNKGIEQYAGTWTFNGTFTDPSAQTPQEEPMPQSVWTINQDGSISIESDTGTSTITKDQIQTTSNNVYTMKQDASSMGMEGEINMTITFNDNNSADVKAKATINYEGQSITADVMKGTLTRN